MSTIRAKTATTASRASLAAEGLAVLKAADIGNRPHAIYAETTPLRDPEHYRCRPGRDRRGLAPGSVIASWLLDLSGSALIQARIVEIRKAECPTPAKAAGRSRPPSTRGAGSFPVLRPL